MQLRRLFLRTYELFRGHPRLWGMLAIPFAGTLLLLAGFVFLEWGPISSLSAQLEANTISLDMARLIQSAQSRILTIKILAAPAALFLAWLWFYCSGRFAEAVLRASGATSSFVRGRRTLGRMTLLVIGAFLIALLLAYLLIGSLSFGLGGAILFLFSLWLLVFLVLLFWYTAVLLRMHLLKVLTSFLLLVFRNLDSFLALLLATAAAGAVVFALLGFPLEFLYLRQVPAALGAFFVVALLLFPLLGFLAGSWAVYALAALERIATPRAS